MNSLLEKFSTDVANIYETDYGDFMRKANTYLNHLRDDLSEAGTESTHQKLNEMQKYLQFTATWDIESTRKKLLADAKSINALLTNVHQSNL